LNHRRGEDLAQGYRFDLFRPLYMCDCVWLQPEDDVKAMDPSDRRKKFLAGSTSMLSKKNGPSSTFATLQHLPLVAEESAGSICHDHYVLVVSDTRSNAIANSSPRNIHDIYTSPRWIIDPTPYALPPVLGYESLILLHCEDEKTRIQSSTSPLGRVPSKDAVDGRPKSPTRPLSPVRSNASIIYRASSNPC